MKSIIFDAGPIISLTMNNLLWLLEPLKEKFGGEFYITEAVKKELVDTPLTTKKFKFEAIQVFQQINNSILKVFEQEELQQKTIELLDLANTSFMAHNNWIRIVQFAEISSLAAALKLNAGAVVIDERTTRELIEDPKNVAKILGNKLHTKIGTNRQNLGLFRRRVSGIKIIRSVELVTIAYELGLLNKYVEGSPEKNIKKELLESVLWGVKLDGCAVSGREIEQIVKLEK